MDEFDLHVDEILPDLDDLDPDLSDLLDSIPDGPLPPRPKRPVRRPGGHVPQVSAPASARVPPAPEPPVPPPTAEADTVGDKHTVEADPPWDIDLDAEAVSGTEGPPATREPADDDLDDDPLEVPEFLAPSALAPDAVEPAPPEVTTDGGWDGPPRWDEPAPSEVTTDGGWDGPTWDEGATAEHDMLGELLDEMANETAEHDMLDELLADGEDLADRLARHRAPVGEQPPSQEPQAEGTQAEGTERPRPRMPVVPLGEVDSFGAQVAAGVVGVARTEHVPGPVEAEVVESEPTPAPSIPLVPPVSSGVLEPTPGMVSRAPASVGASPCIDDVDPAALIPRLPAWRRHLTKLVATGVALVIMAAIVVTSPRDSSSRDDVERVASVPVDEPHASIVAEATTPLVDVYDAPGEAEARTSLEHPTAVGGPLVFLVQEQQGPWLEVLLPVRPNGSRGWIRTDQVRLSKHEYRIRVHLQAHRLELLEGGELEFATSLAVGTRDTPAPGSTFYVKELLKPPDPGTVYGNYAFGLSGFSHVLDSFHGGEGVVGIHGTDDPSVIGTDVSAGSIRLTNADMEKLVGTLPLGTPVDILP